MKLMQTNQLKGLIQDTSLINKKRRFQYFTSKASFSQRIYHFQMPTGKHF